MYESLEAPFLSGLRDFSPRNPFNNYIRHQGLCTHSSGSVSTDMHTGLYEASSAVYGQYRWDAAVRP